MRYRKIAIPGAWALFGLLLLLWLLLRRANDNIQPVDGLLFLALMIQVWLMSRTVRGTGPFWHSPKDICVPFTVL
ncbi:MAG: hypothetical protein ACXWC3_32050 [Burkholderiales bacterium]